MKKIILLLLINVVVAGAWAQTGTDSIPKGKVMVTQKDERIDLLGKKMAEYNESLAKKIRMEKGYRLMLLSTTDRSQAIQVRSKLLQYYPEHNVYMTFQSPYIKLKFGDFLEKDDADDMRKQIADAKIVPGNIYIVPEMVEVKPDKTKLPPTEE